MRRRRARRWLAAGAFAVLLSGLTAGSAFGAFPYTRGGGDAQDYTDLYLGTDTPNDLGDQGFKFLATKAPNNPVINNDPVELGGVRGAHVADPDDSAPTAFRTTLGRPEVSIAVTDSGIRWDDQGRMQDLRLKIRLNTGELPQPAVDRTDSLIGGSCSAYTNGGYDPNGDHVTNLADYACDQRAADALSDPRRVGPANFLTPQDLLIAFSDGSDDDGNGYVDDIAGWDFLDDDNDAYDDVHYNHGSGEAEDSNAEANNGGAIGSCPNCTVVPLRVGDSFVADVNRFAEGVIYATDNRILVVQEALGALNNSPIARDAVEYAYRHGVTVAASAADEAAQHNHWPATYPHTISANSVTTSQIEGVPPENSGAPISYLTFNGCTNFNAHLTIAVPSTSCSSNAVGLTAGYAGLVYSAALSAIKKGALDRSSNPDCELTFDLTGSPGTNNDVPGDPRACPVTPSEVRQLLASGTIDDVGQADDVDFAGSPPGSDNEPSCSPAPSPSCTDTNGAVRTQVLANRPSLVPSGTSYPARKGWDQFYGYGRVNMNKAVKALLDDPASPTASKVPPEAELESPEWFQQIDPAKSSIDVTGQVYARGDSYTCQVYVAPGHYPNNRLASQVPPGDYHPVPAAGGACDGSSRTDPADGLLAQISTSTLKSYFPPETQATGFTGRQTGGGAQTSNGRPDTAPYGFTVKVVATKTQGPHTLTGEDQRAAFLHRDADLLSGFPRSIVGHGQTKGPGAVPTDDGESSPAFADLDGDNKNEMIFGTADGFVHAMRPNGSELPGWPVKTDRPSFVHTGSRAFTEGEISADVGGALLGSVAIGDTNRDGIPEVYAADLEGQVYGWDAGGGSPIFHQHSDIRFGGKPLAPFENSRNGETNRTQHGFLASPVLADIDGDGRDEIVAAAMDRHIYAWNGNGNAVDGYPELVVDPAKIDGTNGAIDPTTHEVTFENGSGSDQQGAIIDTPALADITGDDKPEVIVGTNEEYDETINASGVTNGSMGLLGQTGLLSFGNGRVYALKPGGDADNDPKTPDGILPGWPFKVGIVNLGLLPIVGEGVNSGPVVAPVTCPSGGEGQKIGAMSSNGPAYIVNADGTSCYGDGPDNVAVALDGDVAPSPGHYDTPTLNAVGLGAFGAMPTGTAFVAPTAGVIRAADLIIPEYQGGQDTTSVWNAQTGQFHPGFPASDNDLQFLTGPVVGDIDGLPGEEVLAGTSNDDFNAWDAAGQPVSPAWPKLSTDWDVATPLIGSFGSKDTDNSAKKVAVFETRSGYISAYTTSAGPCTPQSSPRFHHDNANSGDFTRDAVLPGKPENVSADATTIELDAPGDDLLCGAAEHYEIFTSDSAINQGNLDQATLLSSATAPAAPGTDQTVPIPEGDVKEFVAIRAVDERGNVGRIGSADRGPAPINDQDNDGADDASDNCVGVFNPSQADTDGDGVGNACEPDSDGDGVIDDNDNCVSVANPNQADSDGNGIGNACDTPTGGPAPGAGAGAGGAAGGNGSSSVNVGEGQGKKCKKKKKRHGHKRKRCKKKKKH